MVVSGQAVQMNRGIARELTDTLENLAAQIDPEQKPQVIHIVFTTQRNDFFACHSICWRRGKGCLSVLRQGSG